MSYQYSRDPEEDLPDWLKALRNRSDAESQPEDPLEDQSPTSEEESSQSEADPVIEGAGEEPNWLLEIRQRHERESGQEIRQAPQKEEKSEPQLWDEDQEEISLSDTQPQKPVVPQEVVDSEAEAGEEVPEPSDVQALYKKEDSPIEDLPDWLSGIQKSESAESAPAFGQGAEETIAPGELPAWMQALRPPEWPEGESQETPEGFSEPESSGPLSGLSGVLPAEPEIARLGQSLISSGPSDASQNQLRHVAALEKMLSTESTAKEDFSRRVDLPTRVLRLVIGGVLVLATLIPLITGSQIAPRPALAAYPESIKLFGLIDILPPDAPVLVAFEMQPSLFGEVGVVGSTVLDHLLDQQARLVFISTQPTGPALAERLLRQHLSSQPSVSTGDYINLGYLSGGAAALRQFAVDPRAAFAQSANAELWETPILENIENISSFGLVLVISSDAQDARAWIEQVGPYSSSGLIVATSAQATPLLIPYMQSRPPTLRGLVGGFSGAAYYESLRGEESLGRAYWDAYSYGLGALLILILFGGLYGRLIHIRPERVPQTIEEEEHAD